MLNWNTYVRRGNEQEDIAMPINMKKKITPLIVLPTSSCHPKNQYSCSWRIYAYITATHRWYITNNRLPFPSFCVRPLGCYAHNQRDAKTKCIYTMQSTDFMQQLEFLWYEIKWRHRVRHVFKLLEHRNFCDCNIDLPDKEEKLSIKRYNDSTT